MFNFKELTIKDKDVFSKFMQGTDQMNSENSFTTLFLWRHVLKYEFAACEKTLCIKAKYGNHPEFFYFPYGNGDKKDAVKRMMEYSHSKGNLLRIRPIIKEHKEFLERTFPAQFHFIDLRHTYDYIYNIEELILLSGKKFHAKRNHFNQFLKQNDGKYEFLNVTEDDLPKLRDLMFNWIDQQEGDTESEKIAMREMFDNFSELGLKGNMLKIDGNIVAMSFSEQITKTTALVQVEKADKNVRGAYAAINQMTLEHNYKDLLYVNREEDMGIEGLRRAKMSYNPAFLIEKYEAVEVI